MSTSPASGGDGGEPRGAGVESECGGSVEPGAPAAMVQGGCGETGRESRGEAAPGARGEGPPMARADVVILGGGLAGLTLSLQLRQKFPRLDIVVLERMRHPVPEAAHKVGESSVEIGANYFDTVLGLKEHLTAHQLKKFGFRFFFSEGVERLESVTELGASRYLSTPSYQLDRGVFENFLGEHAKAQGVRFLDGARVVGLVMADEQARTAGEPAAGVAARQATGASAEEGSADSSIDAAAGGPAGSSAGAAVGARAARRRTGAGETLPLHEVTYERDGADHTISARWLVDASGRAGLIKRKLDLAEANEHDANAIWFRIGERIDVDEWSSDEQWLNRCDPPYRWLSTNHLCGEGYWVWLIPLSSGSHSVGIVADANLHPLRTMNSFERAMEWLAKHQPRLARALEGKRHLLQDFVALRRFSYGCKQVFSGSRWALTGEAGVFLDPFYSPGSDFIAISNTYITALIEKDLANEPFAPYARIYEQFYFSFYRSTLALYTNQYAMFGDPEVMPVKVIWDYTYYWGVLCQLFFQRRLTDLTVMARMRDDLSLCMQLNEALQKLMREWSRVSAKRNPAHMLDQASLDWFAELNRGLRDELDDAGFKARLRETTTQLKALGAEIALAALADHPQLDISEIRALLGEDLSRLAGSLLFPASPRRRPAAA
jgi:flavin-dependent dehydrogenase